jgi:hypothetical protein
MAMPTDSSILQAALIGYQLEIDKLEAKMADIRHQLGIRKDGRRISAAPAAKTDAAPRKRRKLSAAARKAIAAAQKKRWAEYHKTHAQ